MPDADHSIDPAAVGELLRRTFAQSGEVIAQVRPDQLEGPTPCPAFDVRTLVGHLLFAANRVGAAGRRQPMAEDGPAVVGLADGEWAPAFDKAAAEAVSAWEAPGAMEGEIVLPFGTFPAVVVAQIYVVEQATHAWDLAGAVGARRLLDSALAEEVLAIAQRVILPEYRGAEPMPFAGEVDAGPVAPAYERLAAFMGRRPHWRVAATGDGERSALLETLDKHRGFLRFTLRGLTDEEARRRTTASELCLGGILKHVARVEEMWASFIEQGPSAMGAMDEHARQAHAASFAVGPDESLAGLLEHYQQTSDRTDALVMSLPSLDASQPLPEAPWFPKGTRWSARRVVLHILAETAQHAGHADIVRESLDGAKTMG